MEVSNINEHGVIAIGHREIVATFGRSHAAVNLAFCEDRLYRFSIELHYSHGGVCGPITMDDDGFGKLIDAINSGISQLLRQCPQPSPSDPASVQTELRALRGQLDTRFRQPTLF